MRKYGKTAAVSRPARVSSAAGALETGRRLAAERPMRLAAAVCLAAALVSLVLPLTPSYDPWAWLVWGRELAALELDTSGGPSWKPLPVLVDALLSPLGEAAPEAWLTLARAAWLLSLALAWRLAARLTPPETGPRLRAAAEIVAAVSLLLLAEPQTAWLRHFAHGFSEPVLVALLLGAVDRHLDDRRGHALGLILAASLLRPETWPFLALYAVVAWRTRPGLRAPAVAALIAVPLLWLGGDWAGSGAPFTGVERARVGGVAPSAATLLERFGQVAEQALTLPPPPAWAAAALAAVLAARRGRHALPVLLAAALVWVGIVLLEVVTGYAALARFLVPAAALACVLAGASAGWLWAATPGGSRLHVAGRAPVIGRVTLVLLAVAAIPYAVARAAALPADYEGAVERARDVRAPTAAVAAAGLDTIARCGGVAVEDFSLTPVLAWQLELPLRQVAPAPSSGRIHAGAVVARRAGPLARRASRQRPGARRLARVDGWVVLSLRCPP